ncbi:hypothetical protein [Pilimelia columellifera]|uniref:Uncharacterized protein n=1 Tax=Pilimelia columellifera subsp. columellifera TaxID=706583 RepID=A0ABN3N3D6_9ACTN
MSTLLRGRVRRTALPVSEQSPLTVGGPTVSAWREEALSRIASVEALRRQFAAERAASLDARLAADESGDDPSGAGAAAAGGFGVGSLLPEEQAEAARLDEIDDAIVAHLAVARQTAEKRGMGPVRRWYSALSGAQVQRVAVNIDAATVQLLRVAPADVLRGALPGLLAHLRRQLPMQDLRRVEAERLTADNGAYSFDRGRREILAFAVDAAYAAQRWSQARLRGFRNHIYAATAMIVTIVAGLIAVGLWEPEALPLCFTGPDGVVCPVGDRPSAADVPVVALMGLVAAAVVEVLSLRRSRTDGAPFSLPAALMMLRLPLGSLTAILGILLIRAQFLPGLDQLSSSAQVLGWALAFGLAQQFISRRVERQAAELLLDTGRDDVG